MNASVVINEVAIQPNQVVELYNTASTSADISSWYIDDAGGTTYFTVPSQTILPPESCILFSSDFNFNKTSTDVVRLFDNYAPPTTSSAKLIEQYSYIKAPDLNYSFSKKTDGGSEWQITQSSLGLYNETLASCIPTPTPTSIPIPISTPIASVTTSASTPFLTPTPLPINYQNIFISEVYPYPQTGEHEWIELYNDNDLQVNLDHWSIDDGENTGSAPKSFSLILEAYTYGTVDISASLFNNSGDTVRLLNNNKSEKDSMEYGKITQGKSIARISFAEDSYCEQEQSKNAPNTVCILQPTPLKTVQSTQTTSKSVKKIIPTIKKVSIQTPNKINSFVTSSQTSSTPSRGEVLGVQISETQSLSPTPYLSFVSGSYSLLTIVSIFIKMKNA